MIDAKTDCEALLSVALPFAEQMLSAHGEFYPFGNTMGPDGKITAVAAATGSEHPASTDLIQILREGFIAGARRGEFRATALAYDIRTVVPATGMKSDAVAVSCDHEANYSVIVILPYALAGSKVNFSDAFAQQGDAAVFVRKPDSDGAPPASQR
jgi:hypothetical protein